MAERMIRAGVLHAAGYGGGVLLRILSGHPALRLVTATSRTFEGKPVWTAHPQLRGVVELDFASEDQTALEDLDAVFIAAEHGKAAATVVHLLKQGFTGAIVDLSSDFRFRDASIYPRVYGFDHPAPELLEQFIYGLPEAYSPYPEGTRFIANPGCFATAIELALLPLTRADRSVHASVTALTGASGSGARARETTHFPTRDGNVRTYKVFSHQHENEIREVLGPEVNLSFVPVSGPWTNGIWGTAHIHGLGEIDLTDLYRSTYAQAPFVRLWDGIPELRYCVASPFFDVGIVQRGDQTVIGFALDNLWKGAASQAVHNMNLILGLDETLGLL
jgi:LysW-gamma-L-alpha-aminoadipyl-6-phosphate/LysW-L-glutamyl-5-phosphate reductase